jgi:hypothetical protein
MSLTLPPLGTPELPVLSAADCNELVQAMNYQAAAVGASALYPTAALAIFVPVRLTQRRTYVRAWWLNGAAVAGNADLGVYTISGTTATKVQSIGATAQAGVSAMQTVTISWTLDPGLYYLAFSHSEATTGQYWRAVPNATIARVSGLYTAATQNPLGASITVAADATAYVPFFGLAEQAVV